MSLSSIAPVAASPEKPSALENAAKILGIVGSLAQTGAGIYGASGHSTGTSGHSTGTPSLNITSGTPEVSGQGGSYVGPGIGASMSSPVNAKPTGFANPTIGTPQQGYNIGMK